MKARGRRKIEAVRLSVTRGCDERPRPAADPSQAGSIADRIGPLRAGRLLPSASPKAGRTAGPVARRSLQMSEQNQVGS